MEPYEKLANAIIVNALGDYKDAQKRLLKNPQDEVSKAIIQNVERFMRSDWFMLLSEANPEYLLEKIKERYND